MPKPISGSNCHDTRMCMPEPDASRTPEAELSRSNMSGGDESPSCHAEPSRAAIDSLKVRVSRRQTPPAPKSPPSCRLEELKAAVACGGAAAAAILGTATGPGEIAAVAAGGAMCALELESAHQCESQ